MTRFKGILFLSFALGILSFVILNLLGPTLLSRSTKKIGITGRFRTDNLPDFIINNVSDGLTKLDESGVVEPSLASSWETPDKGKTWFFYLRDDIYWQDGKKVTSETIGYDFSDVEIETPDEKTVIFKLSNAFSPFPTVVSKPTFKKGLLGTGEWRVKNITVAGGYVQELVLTNKEEGKIIYRFYPTEERAKLAYKLGHVDRLINIYDPTPLDSWKSVEIVKESNDNQVVSIFFNVQDKYLSEKSLRQALVYAIDKESFDGERAYGPLSPTSWGYNPQVKTYGYDESRAKELIEELDEEQTKDLEIKLLTTPILLPTAERIAKYWEAIGVKTVLQVSSGVPADYQALLAVFEIPKDPDQYSIWHSTQSSTNISNYQDPRIDKLLEDGRAELTILERSKVYLDFQRYLVEDSPAAFIYHPTSYTVNRK
ncbi:ABC transporter substrate-binding protein [Patescibacteria group bacterium]|nr:ABC transporter substrate-binding protein [Patescibacteria group bacterium]MBU1066611.1 ABC transporter substrate-binding protein [Patescibacteria group bacterium]